MGVPTSEVGYTIATTRRETTKVHKNRWWHWRERDFDGELTTYQRCYSGISVDKTTVVKVRFTLEQAIKAQRGE